MNGQLITAAENKLTEMRKDENQRGLFVKTTKSLNHIGLILLWVCVGLLSTALLIESNVVSLICFVVFALSYLFYLSAERNGGIFEYVTVQPNHAGRQLVFASCVLAVAIGLIYLAFFNTHSANFVIPVLAIIEMAGVTALRFIGLTK